MFTTASHIQTESNLCYCTNAVVKNSQFAEEDEVTSSTEASKRSERMSGEGSASTEAATNVARSSAEVAARPPDTGARGGGRRRDEKEVFKFYLYLNKKY